MSTGMQMLPRLARGGCAAAWCSSACRWGLQRARELVLKSTFSKLLSLANLAISWAALHDRHALPSLVSSTNHTFFSSLAQPFHPPHCIPRYNPNLQSTLLPHYNPHPASTLLTHPAGQAGPGAGGGLPHRGAAPSQGTGEGLGID